MVSSKVAGNLMINSLTHRISGMPGISEVSLDELAEIAEKLDRDGMIQSHDLTHLFDVFRRGMGWSQDHQGRISGENPGQNEHDHESPEDGRDSREDASKDVLPEIHAMDKHQQSKRQIPNKFQ